MANQAPSNVLADFNARIRVLEEKLATLREKMLVITQNMVEEYKKLTQEIKTLNDEVREVKELTENLRDTLKEVIREMQNFAKKEDFLVLEKYINLWDPLKFVREDEVASLVEEKLKSLKVKEHARRA